MNENTLSRRAAHLPTLFARYIKGEIDEPLWKRFVSLLDATESHPQERMALIAFMNDFLLDRSQQALQLSRQFADMFVHQPALCTS